MLKSNISVVKATAALRTPLVAGQVDWIAEPLAFIQPVKYCPAVAGQKAILK